MNDFFENKLNECNIKRYLPKNNSLANYLPFLLSNNFIFISGQLPMTKIGIELPGKIKKEVVLSKYKKVMEITTSNLLWNLSDCIKDSKKKIIDVNCCSIKGYFNCDQEFEEHSALLNLTSDIIIKVLGSNGKHSRVAIGVSSLPKNSPVEIEGIFSISYIN
tara:strand:- start:1967 stop:2452 length:486 start_codon:yes stop_codon:yes gene_type:complete